MSDKSRLITWQTMFNADSALISTVPLQQNQGFPMLVNQTERCSSFHRQWKGRSCLIIDCSDLTILLLGLAFYCFLLNWYSMEDISNVQNRCKRSYFKNFYTHNTFKSKLFVIGVFLQHTAYTAILYFGNRYIGANGVGRNLICKQKGKRSIFT